MSSAYFKNGTLMICISVSYLIQYFGVILNPQARMKAACVSGGR